MGNRHRATDSSTDSQIMCQKDMSSETGCAGRPFLHEVLERVCVGQYIDAFKTTKKFRCFRPQKVIQYSGYCDDFGPMNLASIIKFIELLDSQLSEFLTSKIVYLVDVGRRPLTNAVFLLGAYMILKMDSSIDCVLETFNWLDHSMIEPFRDATFSVADFGLTLSDCWRALQKGKNLEWIKMPSTDDASDWGMIDGHHYEHWDNPLNGDLHMVVPDKFVAFRGPRNLGGLEYSDAMGCRFFSPDFYVDIFKHLGVAAVVRLNEEEYDAAAFTRHGIAHHDLFFPDCTVPPPHVVRRFFDVVDAAAGVVAVHCKAGLGRTGTLIALYLMRRLGFSAREAMGWLRVMRPGSVIGDQQRFLSHADDAAADATAAPASTPTPPDGPPLPACGWAAPEELAAQVAAAMLARPARKGPLPAPPRPVPPPPPPAAAAVSA